MRIEKLLLSLSLVAALGITSFAMPPKEKKEPFCKPPVNFEKKGFPMHHQDCVLMMLEKCPLEKENQENKQMFKKHEPACNLMFVRDLTPEQKEQIKQIKEKNQKAKEDIFNSIKDKFAQLDNELSKEKYNKKTVKNLTKEINALSNKKVALKIAEKQQMRNVLTATQFKKMVNRPTKYDFFAKKLDLTQEQQDKVETLFEQNSEKLAAIKKDLKDKTEQLKQEFEKETSDNVVIDGLSSEISELSKNIFKLTVDTKMELKKILTNEQFNKMLNPKPCKKPFPDAELPVQPKEPEETK